MNQNNWKRRKFYKYASIESALIIINDSTLKFTTPDKFNDPFDIYPYFPRIGFTKMVERVRNENGNQDPRFSRKELEQMFKVANTLKFRQETSKNSAVCCFSKSATILPMWAHYADNHKGCVIEFEMKHEDAVKAATIMLSTRIYRESEILTPIDVTYSNKRPPAYDSEGSTQSKSLAAVFTKATQWSYEEEVRCVKNNVSGIYPFPRHQLKKIIFGLRTTENDKKKIREMIKKVSSEHNIFIDAKEISMERETYNLFF
ncbi:DUF2971 domain-containing protein [Enterobacter cloacae]|uniref:DUF2971 domain-containing protein n=1 Tax=Enterobacter cloacae TaxID=550 RepID=UPI0040436665